MAGLSQLLVRRIFESVIALFVVVTLVFFLARLSGDPAALLLPTSATAEQIAALRAELGLDRSPIVQYGNFILGVLTQADFGNSLRLGGSALAHVLERLVPTLQLTGFALLIATVVGGIAGILSALRRGTWLDSVVQMLTVLGQSVPTFWFGIVLIIVFSVELKWLPVTGSGSLRHLVLPGIALGAPTSALIARMLRSSMLEVAAADFVRTARSKGLSDAVLVTRHIIRNSLIGVITVVMLQLGYLLGGAVVTETVFAYPGMGLLAIQAIYGRDFPVVQAFVVVVAALIAVLNIVADIASSALDPRIEYQ